MSFEEIYGRFSAIDKSAYKEVLEQKSNEVLPLLMDISGSETTGARLLAMFVLGAALSDGTLDKKEYEILKPTFKSFFGDDIDFNAATALVKSMVDGGNGLIKVVDELVDLLGIFSDEFKSELVLICLMICAVDGVVSEPEKEWIKKLIA